MNKPDLEAIKARIAAATKGPWGLYARMGGWSTLKDETGKRYGCLLVRRHAGGGRWACECDCGQHVVVLARNMRRGHTLSCGCLRGWNLR